MSQYLECTTEFTDRNLLASALEEMGFAPEIHDNPQPLYGYHGDQRKESAELIVRRSQIGSASNDIGFVLRDGKYHAIISEYDRQYTFTQEKQNLLARTYATHQHISVAKSRGYVLLGRQNVTTASGKQEVRLRFGVR